ncbi:MAG: 2Fe-2S iron-sulfur cluster binding domain-containing protein [Candidatus Omnitrophica bacterium]|nr:2Fe-2S iron-sulfur cluster binding domain-containing protein [Candidatus Omnitrophota bacterium]
MPKLTIDGKEIEVAPGTRIIEAAKKNGSDVPYYCYHPGLSVAGNCRMCLVEVEKMPKLQISCHMTCQDGMVVKTNTEKILKTRQHILEFLLVNHPLDCPVCDQAGECWLQDYYMKHGLYDSRVNEDKLKKKKAYSIGPTVMLDQDRCILCSRCVRFADEISKTHELGIINRGDHSQIEVFPGMELNNPYSGNVVDICPVGALTDKDFRFKKRVWYLRSTDSICSGCSRGCNIQIQYSTERPHHANGERVIRLKPRYNELVNQWWMCDEGRYSYKFHDHNRIEAILRREPHKVTELDWETAISEIAGKIQSAAGKIGVLVSPQLSNEDLWVIRRVFQENLKVKNLLLVSPNAEGFQDDFLIRSDKNPNSKGAEQLGFTYDATALQSLLENCRQGKLEGLIVFGQDLFSVLEANLVEKALKALRWSVMISSNHNLLSESATYVLPAATYAEEEGTFTNFEGRVQKFERALYPLGASLPEWKILVNLSKALGQPVHYEEAGEIFKEMAGKVKAFEGFDFDAVSTGGSDVRTFAAPTIPELEKYDNIL